MRLYLAELRRATSRTMIRVIALLAVVNFVVAGIIVFLNHDSDGEAERKRLAAEQIHRDCLAGTYAPPGSGLTQRDRGPVFISPEFGRPVAPAIDSPERGNFCREERDVALAGIRQFRPSKIADVTEQLTGLLGMISIVMGASLIGAEWQPRTLTTHLTWEPRRVRSFLTKAAAAITVAGSFFLFTQLLEVATLYPSAVFRGVTDTSPGFWGDLLGLIGRGTVAACVTAALGFAIATVTTSTVFALAFLFLISLLDGLILVALLELQRYSLFRNLAGYVSAEGVGDFIRDGILYRGRSPGGSGIVILFWAAMFLTSATLHFRRRDFA